MQCADWMTPRRSQPSGRVPRVVAMGGDGVGREVIAAAVEVVEATGVAVEIVSPPHGADVAGGFPAETRKICDGADAILFGAAEKLSIPVLMYLRGERNSFANIRPSASLFGTKPVVDLVIVRELSEGLYPGREGDLAELGQKWPDFKDPFGNPLPREGKFAIRVITPQASRRIGKHAAELTAQRAKRKGRAGKLTIVTKQNVLRVTDSLFRTCCEEEARAIGVAVDHLYVDEAARRLASRPEQFDVIVTSNLFGDILSDVAAESVGGMPVAPSAGIADGFAYFEPVHGSAPDIVGKGLANPFGSILSAAMALYYLGFEAASDRVVAAVQATHVSGVRTSDMGGSSSTSEVTRAVRAALAGGSK